MKVLSQARLQAAAVVVVVALPATSVASNGSSAASQLVRDFACIHTYEGAWNANTGNGYYGGLQMDMEFMRAYGREFLTAYGTADRWPVAVQMTVAMRAYLAGRGFYPWPHSARLCGLI